MSRKYLMAGNWKMNNTYGEAVVLCQEISNRSFKDWTNKIDIAVCPPFVDLKGAVNVFEFDHCKIGVGAQDVHWESAGAYTGEISVRMLEEIGCSYCIVGHSERRTLFGETNEEVNRKIKALLAGREGITPVVCVGESLAVRDEGTAIEFVTAQVHAAFASLDADQVAKCVIAYEPIWAIGTGRTATPEQAEEMCVAIRSFVAEEFDVEVADVLRIIYGGSMNPGNAERLLAQEDIDGGLIGGASLDADSFVSLIKAALDASA